MNLQIVAFFMDSTVVAEKALWLKQSVQQLYKVPFISCLHVKVIGTAVGALTVFGIPKPLPQFSFWYCTSPAGTGMGRTPSGLRFGMFINSVQAVPSMVVPAPTWNGSGAVDEDSFH